MYAETGLLFPYFQNFPQEVLQTNEFCRTPKFSDLMSNLVHTSTICEYDMGGEGDLFKAPEPIIEEPVLGLDPMAAALSMISCGEDVISSQGLKVAGFDSLESEQLLNEVFYEHEKDLLYECEKDLLQNSAIETPLSEIVDIKIPALRTEESQIPEDKTIPDVPFQKSVSSGCLSSKDWIQGAALKPSFLDFPGMGMDLSAVYGMRRAYSEGDIKTLGNGNGNGNVSVIHSPLERPLTVANCTTEERWEKLSRYRNKRTKRNFGRKIKYACRKALADSQPRIRGRFARTEDSETKRQ